MTDATATDATATDGTATDATEIDDTMTETNIDTETSEASTDDFRIRTNLYRAALGLFVLLAVVAVVQLYASVNASIATFVAEEYRPLFRAAFNLVVLLVSGIGISLTVRELSGE
ncbi:hypothetical protein [Halorussus salinus]|uniref:hypothetical protein n=1 Tax=Halorussus salinus TaxID=1364935 RepID=UPI00109296DE|nr:hypothetical protein [Halorussus salinus]